MSRFTGLATGCVLLCGMGVSGAVPAYSLEVVAEYEVTTVVTGASPGGTAVGWQVIAGLLRGFTASVEGGLELLPLPDGYISSIAQDMNSAGVVVGAVSQSSLPTDSGEPAIWVPDGSGGYTVHIPQQFATLPSPLGQLTIAGGMATAINDAGVIVGWSRYQGFQGGPATRFSLDGAPENLQALGFETSPEDLSESGLVCGGGLRMDLNTGTITELGVPEPVGGVSFTLVFGYAVNDAGQVVAAARRATSTADRWLTYVYDDVNGWGPHNPSQLPMPNVGFYDNNNLNDVVASGGVRFAAEDELALGFAGLLEPGFADWTVALGFIGDDRSVTTTAFNASTDTNAVVRLVPVPSDCPQDLTGDGVVDSGDLSVLLNAFGQGDAGDINGDSVTDADDLGILLSAFGSACGAAG